MKKNVSVSEKNEKSYICRLETLEGSAEAAWEILIPLCEHLTLLNDFESGQKSLIGYFESRKNAQSFADAVSEQRSILETHGIRIGPLKIKSIRREDWSEAWKKYFKVMKISSRLIVKPEWLEYKNRKENDIVIEINPGMSFGTGKHPTTQFCLKLIEKSRKKQTQSCADIGCGSGILLIAAAKLGYHPLLGIDNDAEAIETSKENLARNDVLDRVGFLKTANIADFSSKSKFDLVVANILSTPIIENKERISSLLKTGGTLILSGIMASEEKKIRDSFGAPDFVEDKFLSDGNWVAFSFVKT